MISFDTSVVRTCFGLAMALYDCFGCGGGGGDDDDSSSAFASVPATGATGAGGEIISCLIVHPPESRMSVGKGRPINEGGKMRGGELLFAETDVFVVAVDAVGDFRFVPVFLGALVAFLREVVAAAVPLVVFFGGILLVVNNGLQCSSHEFH